MMLYFDMWYADWMRMGPTCLWTGRGHTHSTAVYSFIRPTSLWQFTENNRFCPQASHYDPNRTKNPHTKNIRVTDRFLCIFTPRRYAIVICSSVYQTHNRCVALVWIVVHIECNNGSRSLTLTAVLWYFNYCYTVEIGWKMLTRPTHNRWPGDL